jgi:hypothetical protein
MKILTAIACLIFSKVSAFTEAATSSEINLTLVYRKSLSLDHQHNIPIEICLEQTYEFQKNFVNGGLRNGKQWTPFKLRLNDQLDIKFGLTESILTHDLLKESSLRNRYECWTTSKDLNSPQVRTKWVSESTDNSTTPYSLTCFGISCYLMHPLRNNSQILVELDSIPENIYFCWIKNHWLLITSSNDDSFIFFFKQRNIATIQRRILAPPPPLIPGRTDTDISGSLTVSGNSVPVTLKCGVTAVTSCLKECPGKPYSLFESLQGTCSHCLGPDLVQWDDKMNCQRCSTPNNGYTIGYFWDEVGAACTRCDPSCKTCLGPGPGDCIRCWNDMNVDYFSSMGFSNAAASYLLARRILTVPTACPVTLPAINCAFMSNCQSCLSTNTAFCYTPVDQIPLLTLKQNHQPVDCDITNGFYKYQGNKVCGICIANCKVCTTSYDCQLCDASYQYYDAGTMSCVSACRQGTFPSTSPTKHCHQCHASCQTCTGDLSSQCSTCDSGDYLQLPAAGASVGTCVNSCPANHFAENYVCTPCPSNCASCYMNYCYSCTGPNYLYNDNHCGPCNEPGNFIDNGYCQPCSSNCLTCSGPWEYSCNTCITTLYHSESNHTCTLCNWDWTFKVEGPPKKCFNCHSNCKNCNGPNDNQCTSCDTSNGYGLSLASPGTCVSCQQWANQYINGNGECVTCSLGTKSTGTGCEACPLHCAQCDFMMPCMSCEANFYYDSTSSYTCIECGAGKYISGNTCYPCSVSFCDVCNSGGQCTQCQSGYMLDMMSYCVVCPAGSYVTGGYCYPCTGNCADCSGNGQCTQCASGYELTTNHNCMLPCGPGTFRDGDSCNTCMVSNCQTCSSYYQCSTCISGHDLTSTYQCIHCGPGYFRNGDSCDSCMVSWCVSCSSANQCSQCDSGFDLTSTYQCLQCMPGTYRSGDSCNACDVSNCQSCTGPSQCSQCSGDYYLADSTHCCAPNTIWDSGNCQTCTPPCATCSGAVNQCASCETGYFYDPNHPSGDNCNQCGQGDQWSSVGGGTCISCYVSNCQQCSSPYVCSLCNQGYQIDGGSCQQCSLDHYSTGDVCYPCHSTCNSCTGSATACTSCISGYGLPISYTLCQECTTDQFLINDHSPCYDCDPSCKTCEISSSTCLSCNYPFKLLSSSCSSTCDSNQYWSSDTGGRCNDCPTVCTQCTGPSACTSCISNHILVNGVCTPCDSHEYASGNQCHECDASCLTCESSAGFCLTCPPESIYDAELHTCTGCTSNQIWDSGNCQTCTPPCATCSGAVDSCTSCQTDHGLTGNECLSCNGNLFYRGPLLSCGTCTPPCATCSGSATSCLTCEPNHGIISGNQCQACATNQFWTDGPSTCHACPPDCKVCLSDLVCTECEPGHHLHPNNLCAVCQINNGYFIDENDHRCKPCETLDCIQCSSATTCLACESPANLLATGECLDCSGLGQYFASISRTCSDVEHCANFDVTCQQCEPGYSLIANLCLECPAGCAACSSLTQCTQCDSAGLLLRYRLDGAVDCDPCTDAGYLVVNGECRPCSAPCAECGSAGPATVVGARRARPRRTRVWRARIRCRRRNRERAAQLTAGIANWARARRAETRSSWMVRNARPAAATVSPVVLLPLIARVVQPASTYITTSLVASATQPACSSTAPSVRHVRRRVSPAKTIQITAPHVPKV